MTTEMALGLRVALGEQTSIILGRARSAVRSFRRASSGAAREIYYATGDKSILPYRLYTSGDEPDEGTDKKPAVVRLKTGVSGLYYLPK